MKTIIGFIGLGMMGAPMAARLVASGNTVHITNRSKEKAESLKKLGAHWHETPADVAAVSDIVISMVTNDEALRSIADRVLPALRNGGIHVDCSTVSPALTSTLEKEYSENGKGFLHSPVLGSIPQATDGSLLLFVGGGEAWFQQSEPVLRNFGSKVWRFPTAAQATSMKLIMNSFIAGMIATLSQALQFGKKTGIDGNTILEILGNSVLNSAMYQSKGRSILDQNFTPRFFLENLLKDTDLFRDAATSAHASAPVADMVRERLEEAVARGFSKEDYSAIVKVF